MRAHGGEQQVHLLRKNIEAAVATHGAALYQNADCLSRRMEPLETGGREGRAARRREIAHTVWLV